MGPFLCLLMLLVMAIPLAAGVYAFRAGEYRRGPISIVPRRTYADRGGPAGSAFRQAVAAIRGGGALAELRAATAGVANQRLRANIQADALLAAMDATLARQAAAEIPHDALREIVAGLDGADDAVRATARYIAVSEWLGLFIAGNRAAVRTPLMLTAGEVAQWTARGTVDGLFLDRATYWCPAQIVITNIGIAAIGDRTMRAPRTAIITIESWDRRTKLVRLADRIPLAIRFADEIDAWTFHAILMLGQGDAGRAGYG